jgi:hypothetical protein
MPDLQIYERRAREAEDLARLVSQPQNRRRYLAIASAWRKRIAGARAAEAARPPHAA